MENTAELLTGIVRLFNQSSGLGFITPDTGGHDVFAHASQIRTPGVKALRAAQRVSFELLDLPQGRTATNIRLT